METRFLGGSGLKVSVLSLGTMTFGGAGRFARVGSTEVDDARWMVDRCLDAGVNLFDTADIYSDGRSEEILGAAVQGKRDRLLIATKVFFRFGSGANDVGLSRAHIIRACEDSLRRLNTDYIDLYQSHGFDAGTPLEETLRAYDDLIRAGKVRYIGASNYSGWHLMKALAVADREHLTRYVSQQVYYSLVGRELEYELVPLSVEEKLGILVWSPLAAGFLSGKFARGANGLEGARWSPTADPPMAIGEERAFAVVEAIKTVAAGRGASPAQVALAWLLRKPGVTSLIIGARNREQLEDNLGAAALPLSDEEMTTLDAVSAPPPLYPYWHQRKYAAERNPPLPGVR